MNLYCRNCLLCDCCPARHTFFALFSALVHCLKRKIAMQELRSTDVVRRQHFFSWFDMKAAAVATILLGLFQLLLSAPLVYTGQSLPNFFILPLVSGIIIVAGGSFTMAKKRNSGGFWAYCWGVTLLLLLYDIGAIILHFLMSVYALKALKSN
ncbi:uncharacterized protein si:dkey-9i23.16 [Syngnathus acus]|uniref:uncharacterized protein si:dkey-9i23.16 n=1 Tax=Syngnathus acus TaxID=161584 RepID=UPI001885BBBA|nr:uncharacterized protein si:dkey-9i23.16 [Syngnathus acus]